MRTSGLSKPENISVWRGCFGSGRERTTRPEHYSMRLPSNALTLSQTNEVKIRFLLLPSFTFW